MGALDLPVKALSIRQPWAWAILHAGKDIENRTAAAVAHGMKPGRIAIHAAKGMTRDEYEHARNFMRSIGVTVPLPFCLIRGAVVGTATVTAIVKEHQSPWFFGPRGLVLTDVKPLPQPIPAIGALGYFNWKPSGEQEVAKPWMSAWPDEPVRARRPAEPVERQDELFGGHPQ